MIINVWPATWVIKLDWSVPETFICNQFGVKINAQQHHKSLNYQYSISHCLIIGFGGELPIVRQKIILRLLSA